MSGYLSRLSGDVRRDAPEPARGFGDALRAGSDIAVIAEIKRSSPSEGRIAPDADVSATARLYADGGAAAMSVLVAERDFGGCLADLRQARAARRPAGAGQGVHGLPRAGRGPADGRGRRHPRPPRARLRRGGGAAPPDGGAAGDGRAGRGAHGRGGRAGARARRRHRRGERARPGVARGRSRPPARAPRDAAAVGHARRRVGHRDTGRRRGRREAGADAVLVGTSLMRRPELLAELTGVPR